MARAKSISTSPSPKISPRKLPLSHVPPNSLSVVNGSAPKNIQSRPPLRNNFDLEPNPFEQSFATSGSTSRPSLSSIRDNASTDDHPQHPKSFNSPNESNIRQKSPSASSTSSSHHSRKLSTESISNGNHPPTSNETPKPILPPLAAITSPSEQSYSWAFSTGLANSLRSGPLSPAMLTGPQQPQQQSASTSALFSFDPSGAFRTGLTPSTGLTPLVGGPVAFPPPSPNTAAAFYAIVNNGPAGTGQNSSTITPGTLNAYASVLQGASAPAVSVNNGSQSSSTAGASAAASVNGSAAAGSTITSAIPAAFEGSSSQASRYTSSYPQSGTQSQNKSHANHDQSSSSYASDNSSTSAAANGLFLLSQAHQELTKREEAQKQNQSQQGQTQSLVNGKRGSKRKSDAASTASSTTAPVSSVKSLPPSSKRSRVTSQAPSSVNTRTASARRGSAAASLSTGDGDDDLDVDEDEEDYDPMEGDLGSMRDKDKDRLPTSQSQSGAQKKPETEEEKRKNFLERNRQAALKCRQRKKAWLAQLQAKVEFLTTENDQLKSALATSRDEIARLTALVNSSMASVSVNGTGIPVVGMVGVPMHHRIHAPSHHTYSHHTNHITHSHGHGHHPQPVSVNVALPGASAAPSSASTSPTHTHHNGNGIGRSGSGSPHSPSSDGRSSSAASVNGHMAHSHAHPTHNRSHSGNTHGIGVVGPQPVAATAGGGLNGRAYAY